MIIVNVCKFFYFLIECFFCFATKDIKSFCRIMDFLTYDSMICGIRMLQYFQMRKLM